MSLSKLSTSEWSPTTSVRKTDDVLLRETESKHIGWAEECTSSEDKDGSSQCTNWGTKFGKAKEEEDEEVLWNFLRDKKIEWEETQDLFKFFRNNSAGTTSAGMRQKWEGLSKTEAEGTWRGEMEEDTAPVKGDEGITKSEAWDKGIVDMQDRGIVDIWDKG